MATAEATWTIVIDRSPQEVFDYLADFNRHAEWSPKPFRVDPPAGPATVGAVFTSYGKIPVDKKEHRAEVEVTEVIPPTVLVFVAKEPDGEYTNRFVLTPEGSGTRVERTLIMPKPPRILGLLFPVIVATVVKPGVQKGMALLRKRLESDEEGRA